MKKIKFTSAMIVASLFVIASTPANAQWRLTGNAGTIPGTNFIGTTDASALMFKVNNTKAGQIDFASAYNTSFGYETILSATGDNNAAFGLRSLRGLTTGYCNAGFGGYTLWKNTSGLFNTALGYGTLTNNTTGSTNTAVGSQSLSNNFTGYSNVGVGYGTLVYTQNISNLVAIGDSALYFNGRNVLNTLGGTHNTAVGSKALYNNTSGYGNTATGFNSLYANTTGVYNAAFGRVALYANTTGYYNTAFGSWALGSNSTGSSNTAVGMTCLLSNTTGYSNTAVGGSALYYLTTGSYNTAIGASAGLSVTALTNTTSVGYNASATASNQVMLGNTSVTSVKAAGSFVIYSDGRFKKNIKENVPGLEFIKQLKPVTYNYDIHGLNKYMGIKGKEQDDKTNEASLENEKAITEKERKIYTGFIAQDVEKVAEKFGYDFSGVYKPQNDKDAYGLSYADFVVPLVKAVQELSADNDKKNDAIDKLLIAVDDLQKQLNELKNTQPALKNNSFNTAVADQAALSTEKAKLEQNAPNPSNGNTLIRYFIPATVHAAQLVINSNSGQVIKTMVINAKGSGQIAIHETGLPAGNYYYSLVIDGKKMDTKKMEIIK